MKLVIHAFCLLMSWNSLAENAGLPAKKSTISTQIYEKEKSEKSFTSTVKMVREVQGAWEVIFDKHPGVYTLSDKSDAQSLLVDAQKSHNPVIVRVDEENNRLLSAQWGSPPNQP